MKKITSSDRQNTYKDIFDFSPVALIEMDLSAINKLQKILDQKTVTNFRKYLMENMALTKKTFVSFKIVNANKAAFALYGARSKKQLKDYLVHSFTTHSSDLLVEQFVSLLEGDREFSGEFQHKTDGRKYRDIFLRLKIAGSKTKPFERVIMTLQDITTWKNLERQLRKRAQLDGLTHVYNHSTVMQRLEQELIRAKRYGLSLSCMMIDLDFFKVINDKFGHQKGDQILKRVSQMIKVCFRRVDVVGRYGGDEFLIILPQTKSQFAHYAAQRLKRTFGETLFSYRKAITFHITLSIGIAGYPTKKVKDAKDLVSMADKAMYACKAAGRNQIKIAGH